MHHHRATQNIVPTLGHIALAAGVGQGWGRGGVRTITTLILRHVACIPEEDFIDLMLFVHHQLQLISVATDRQEQQIERERGGEATC